MRSLNPTLIASTVLTALTLPAAQPSVSSRIDAAYPQLEALYQHLHSHPELSLEEEQTAKRLGAEIARSGFKVTYNVGGHGIVGVLQNGPGPTLLIRTDLDALPITETTGLPYASKIQTQNKQSQSVGVMHACGHDVHMTVFAGTARLLSELKESWSGTLVLIGQPAEELGAGAAAMLQDGLFKKFPKPDACLALHVAADLEAGKVGYCKEYAFANVDSVDITIHGKGGHGAAPHKTIDPVVIASRVVLGLQTIVSREIDPITPAVVTVGSIHGGTKHNIIPDNVDLQLTVRTYSDDSRTQILKAIKRITQGVARSAGVPDNKLPEIKVEPEYTPALYNDPKLTEQLVRVFTAQFGAANVVERKPEMIGEDFARYGRTADDIPICMFRLGTIKKSNPDQTFPGLHTSRFAPVPEPTIKTGVRAMVTAALEVLSSKGAR